MNQKIPQMSHGTRIPVLRVHPFLLCIPLRCTYLSTACIRARHVVLKVFLLPGIYLGHDVDSSLVSSPRLLATTLPSNYKSVNKFKAVLVYLFFLNNISQIFSVVSVTTVNAYYSFVSRNSSP